MKTLVIRLEPTAHLGTGLDLSHIQNMQALEELWIIGSIEPNYWFTFDAGTPTSHVPLRRLHINVRTRCFSNGMLKFITFFRNLTMLDVKNTFCPGRPNLLTSVVTSVANAPINAISLNRLFKSDNDSGLIKLNVIRSFCPLRHKRIEFLDLRYNSITHVYRGVVICLVHLRILDMSNNMIHLVEPQDYYPLVIELLVLHPNIEMLIFENQGSLQQSSANIDDEDFSSKRKRRSSAKQRELWYYSRSATPAELNQTLKYRRTLHPVTDSRRLKACMSKFNVSSFMDFLTKPDKVCDVGRCLIWYPELPCFYMNLTDAIGILDDACYARVRVPIAPKLTEAYVGNVQVVYYQNRLYLQKGFFEEMPPICLRNNSIKSIDISASGLLQILNTSVVRFQGLGKLKTLNFENTVKKNTYRLNFTNFQSFHSLSVLNFASTGIQLRPDLRICSNVPKLREIVLSNNNINTIASDTFSKCQHLRFVDLSYNALTSIPADIRSTFDKLSLAASHELVLDFSQNTFACTCHAHSVDTVEWLISEQRKVSIRHWDSYTCLGLDGYEIISRISLKDYKDDCQTRGKW